MDRKLALVGRVVASTLLLLPALAVQPRDAAAQASTDSSPILPVDPAVRHGVLANGLSYYIRQNSYPAQRAELRLVVDAGSMNEDQDQLGLAHLLEHLAFDGTPQFPGNSVWKFFERIGLRVGADVNARTGYEETVYQLTVPTDSAALLTAGITLLEEWAHRLTLDPAQLLRERKVVVEEWRSTLGAGQRLSERQSAVILRGSRYLDRAPIGVPALVAAAPISAVRRFYADWYRPERMAIVIVGDIDVAALEARVRRQFGVIPPGGPPREEPTREVPPVEAARAAVLADSEISSTSVTVLYRQGSRPTRTEADFRRLIALNLYDAMLNERLGARAMEAAPPFLSAGAGDGGLVRGVQAYQLSAGAPAGGITTALKALLAEVGRVETEGFTATELTRARTDMLRGLSQAEDQRERISSASLAAQLVDDHLVGDPTLSFDTQLELSRRLLPLLTEVEIRTAGDARRKVSPPIVIASVPAAGPKPTEEELLAVVTGPAERLASFTEPAAETILMKDQPVGGRVLRSDRIEAIGVQRLELSNGVRVLLKPTTFNRGEILFSSYRSGGFAAAAEAVLIPAATAQSIICGSGISRFDPVTLSRMLTGRVVTLGCSINRYAEGLSGSSAPADLETLLQLVYLQSTAPRLDTLVVARYRAGLDEAVRNRSADPHEAMADTLRLLLSNHSPELRLLDSSFVQQLDPTASLSFFQQRFGDASGFTFVLVGNFDPEAIVPLLERYLGGLPTQPRADSLVRRSITPPEGAVERVLHRGREPRSTTALVFHREGPVSRLESVAALAMEHVLRQRLQDRLRQVLGGVYGVSVSSAITPVPGISYRISVEFDADPGRQEELTTAVYQEIEHLVADGPTAAEMDSYRTERSRGLETARKTNGYWLSAIAVADQRGWPLAEIPSDREAEELTESQVRMAAEQFLDKAGRIRVTLLPE